MLAKLEVRISRLHFSLIWRKDLWIAAVFCIFQCPGLATPGRSCNASLLEAPTVWTTTTSQIDAAIKTLSDSHAELVVEKSRPFESFSASELDRIRIIDGYELIQDSARKGYSKERGKENEAGLYDLYMNRVENLLGAIRTQIAFLYAKRVLIEIGLESIHKQTSNQLVALGELHKSFLSEREILRALMSFFIYHPNGADHAEVEKLKSAVGNFLAAYSLRSLIKELTRYGEQNSSLAQIKLVMLKTESYPVNLQQRAQEKLPILTTSIERIRSRLLPVVGSLENASDRIPFFLEALAQARAQVISLIGFELTDFRLDSAFSVTMRNLDTCCHRCSDCAFKAPLANSPLDRSEKLDGEGDPLFYRMRSRLWPYLGFFNFIESNWLPWELRNP